MFIIRQVGLSDVGRVKELNIQAIAAVTTPYNEPHAHDDLDAIENEYIRSGGEFYVGETDGYIVAMGAIKKITNAEAELKRMRVDPGFQRKGYGQMMLTALETRAKELGFEKICLDTSSTLSAAMHMYMKNAYVEMRREKNEHGDDTIYYEKQLSLA